METLVQGVVVLFAPQEELRQEYVVESHPFIGLAQSDVPDLVSLNQLGKVHVGVLDDMFFTLRFSTAASL